MEQVWKYIDGFEDLYMVSNFGSVKSLEKMWATHNKAIRTKPETIMKQSKDSNGYFQVCLSKGGKAKNYLVHRLVAKAFIENPHNKGDVNHINCNKTDNRVENLEWATRSENIKHALDNNLVDSAKGSRHGMSLLKEQDVIEIRSLKDKYTKKQLAEMYGVGRRSINEILNGKSWKHIL
jgi:hypothetical protein